jgi:hypothetical protein
MKKITISTLVLILMSILVLQTSCKKSSSSDTPAPSKMTGNWLGIRGTDTISVTITDLSGTSTVTSYRYGITRGSYKLMGSETNSSGLASISNLQFLISLGSGQVGPAYLNGKFNSTQDTLTGSYAVYPYNDTIVRFEGKYTALKTN